jgi:small-conductance mechanosensitive channel
MTTPSQQIKTSSNATVSLICGILAWLGLFGLGGVLAVIFGHVAKKEIRTTDEQIDGDGIATAGLILGYLNIAITVLGVLLAILVIVGAIAIPLFMIPYFE